MSSGFGINGGDIGILSSKSTKLSGRFLVASGEAVVSGSVVIKTGSASTVSGSFHLITENGAKSGVLNY